MIYNINKQLILESSKPKFEDVPCNELSNEYGVSIKKDKDGYFVTTHRSRSKSYPTVDAIPVSHYKKVGATG